MNRLLMTIPFLALAACAGQNTLPPPQAPVTDACTQTETRALTSADLTERAFVLVEPTADFRVFGQGAGETDVVEITLTRTSDELGFRINCAVSVAGRTYFHATVPAGEYRLGVLERRRSGKIVRVSRDAEAAKPFSLTPGVSYLGRPFWVINSDRTTISFYPATDALNAETMIKRIAPDLADAMRFETMK